jgi:protein-disulfide isomerase
MSENQQPPRGVFTFAPEQLGAAILGGIAGAVLSLAVLFAVHAAGLLNPFSDKRINAYLLAHPEVLEAMSDELQEQQAEADQAKRQAAVDKIGLAKFFDAKVAFVTGPAKAKTTMVEFFDYNCPYCKASLPVFQKYYESHKNDTRFAFIEFPIKGPDSTQAAQAAVAARAQGADKYLAFHFAMMGGQEADDAAIIAAAQKAGLDLSKLHTDMQSPAVAESIAATLRLAHDADVDGTPTFIVDGKVHPGMMDDASLKDWLKG